jgi:hypothetical protein
MKQKQSMFGWTAEAADKWQNIAFWVSIITGLISLGFTYVVYSASRFQDRLQDHENNIAKKEIQKLKGENLKIVSSFAARSLSDTQENKMLELLKPHPNTVIIMYLNYNEATNYAKEFSGIFHQAGWQVKLVPFPDGTVNIGIVISKVNGSALNVDLALFSAGIDFNFVESAEDHVMLRIGLNTVILDGSLL